MKFFFGHDEIYDTHDSSRSFKLLLSSWAIAAPPQRQGLGRRVHQTDCQKIRIVYSFNGSRRPRSLDQRGFRNGADAQIGGGVRVGDAFQSDCRIMTYSNVGSEELCPNFPGGASCLVCVEQGE